MAAAQPPAPGSGRTATGRCDRGRRQRLRLRVRPRIGPQRRSRAGRARLGAARHHGRPADGQPGYVAGEETAAVRAINGGPAKPTDKPPRPFEAGVAGRPTLVSNVETLANLPFLQRQGSAAFRSQGTPRVVGHASWPPSPEPDDRRCSTNCRTAYRSLNCLPCTEFRPTRCEARLWAGTSRACSTDECSRHRWITRPCAGSAAAWAAVRSR